LAEKYAPHRRATHCITLQHIATHCNTLQHTAAPRRRPVVGACATESCAHVYSLAPTPNIAPNQRCVAVCCSVLQCVAIRCSVLQCVAVSSLLRMSTARSTCIAEKRSSVLQCVAACCCVLQCVAVCCSGSKWADFWECLPSDQAV